MNNYIISGKFQNGKYVSKFTKTVSSLNEKNAVEKVYSTIGSQHGVERRLIDIESVALEE